MKRILLLILALVFVFSLAACNMGDRENTAAPSPSSTPMPSPSGAPHTTSAPDTGKNNDTLKSDGRSLGNDLEDMKDDAAKMTR